MLIALEWPPMAPLFCCDHWLPGPWSPTSCIPEIGFSGQRMLLGILWKTWRSPVPTPPYVLPRLTTGAWPSPSLTFTCSVPSTSGMSLSQHYLHWGSNRQYTSICRDSLYRNHHKDSPLWDNRLLINWWDKHDRASTPVFLADPVSLLCSRWPHTLLGDPQCTAVCLLSMGKERSPGWICPLPPCCVHSQGPGGKTTASCGPLPPGSQPCSSSLSAAPPGVCSQPVWSPRGSGPQIQFLLPVQGSQSILFSVFNGAFSTLASVSLIQVCLSHSSVCSSPRS